MFSAIHLKSNMDRFIVYKSISFYTVLFYLKSNMDRFIDPQGASVPLDPKIFKIQYG